MGSKVIALLPKVHFLLEAAGENIKLARLRRKLTTMQVAERAGITRTTLWNIERGTGGVSIAAYAQVLLVLGLEKDLLKFAGDDELGKKIQDTNLLVKKRAPRR